MSRKKTTVYIDEGLLRAARVLAARTGKRDSEVMEEALRRYLVVGVLDRVGKRADLDEEEAMNLADDELHKMHRSPQ